MNSAPSEAHRQPSEATLDQAVRAVARARADCLALGLAPAELARLLVEEAALAWMVAGLDEREIRDRLDAVVSGSVKPWLARLRHRSGLCDCVAEVHFAALCEAARGGDDAAPDGEPAAPREAVPLSRQPATR